MEDVFERKVEVEGVNRTWVIYYFYNPTTLKNALTNKAPLFL